MPLRFHLDEHIAAAVAAALRRRGIDVTTTVQAGLSGLPDERHLAYGLAELRVIYTQDSDFLIAASRGVPHAGVVYCAPNTRSLRQVIDFLILLDSCMNEPEMSGAVEYVPQ